ncbi:MAG TPA: AtpZ/AtpI family protein [Polyangiaceae bacterium]|nr:AtpZ/AtpI family protein [Polyangiaceae bacterium]
MQQDWKGVGRYGTVGLEFALSILVGLFAGQWLDKKLGTHGILTLVGLAYGLAAGGRAVYRALKSANREADEQERQDRARRKKFNDDGDSQH